MGIVQYVIDRRNKIAVAVAGIGTAAGLVFTVGPLLNPTQTVTQETINHVGQRVSYELGDGSHHASGTVVVKASGSVLAVKAVGTVSGSVLRADRLITSSGSLAVEGTITGATLFGFGLVPCTNAVTAKLLYDQATGKFLCGTDQAGAGSTPPEVGTASFSGGVLRLADARYVKKQGDTMTGALTINLTSGSLGLKIIQTASGNIIHAEKTLTSSGNIIAVGSIVTRNTLSGKTLVVSGNASVTGSLVVNKSISGATLEILGTASGQNLFATRSITGTNIYAATTFGGAGLASCSNTTTSKLLYNSATKQFSCGTDQTGGGSTAPEVGTSSFSGAVLKLNAGSGYTLFAASANTTPSSNTTRYFGITFSVGAGTTSGIQRVYIPTDGTIKRIIYSTSVGTTLGSAHFGTGWLRLNNTTDTLISQAVKWDTSFQSYTANVNIPVVAGDYFEIKERYPGWTTTPTNTRGYATVFVK